MSAVFLGPTTGATITPAGDIASDNFSAMLAVKIPTPDGTFQPILTINNSAGTQHGIYLDADGTLRIQESFTAHVSASLGTYTAGTWVKLGFRGFQSGGASYLRGNVDGAYSGSTGNQDIPQTAFSILQMLLAQNGNDSMAGRIAHFRVWKTFLSDAQMATEFTSPTPVITANLVADFDLTSSLNARAYNYAYASALTPDANSGQTIGTITFNGDTPTFGTAPTGPPPTLAIGAVSAAGYQTIIASGTFTSPAGTPSIQVSASGPASLGPSAATISGSTWTKTFTGVIGPGAYTVTASIADASGQSDTKTAQSVAVLGVNAPLNLPSSFSPTGLVLTPASLSMNYGDMPSSFVVTTPEGIEVDGATLSSSAPSVGLVPLKTDVNGRATVNADGPGDSVITVKYGNLTATLALHVLGGPPAFTTTSLPQGIAGQIYDAFVTASGLPTISVTGLPAGMASIATPSAGKIEVKGAAPAGSYPLVFSATNGVGPAVTLPLSLVINPVTSSPPPVVTPPATTGGSTGGPSSVTSGLTVMTMIANFNDQITTTQKQTSMVQLAAALGRMQKNVTQVNSSVKTVTVSGGSLYDVAAAEYGDATAWTVIAKANGLTDPQLHGVTTLIIPPYDGGKSGGVLPA